MFTTRSTEGWEEEGGCRGRQLGDHLPWRCLQKVLPRAKANKAQETRDRLGHVGAASLSLPLSALLLVPPVMFIMRRFTQFSWHRKVRKVSNAFLTLYLLYLSSSWPDWFCSASFIHSVGHSFSRLAPMVGVCGL